VKKEKFNDVRDRLTRMIFWAEKYKKNYYSNNFIKNTFELLIW